MFQVGEVGDTKNLAWVLGCKIGTLPSSYMSMPLGVNFKSKQVLNARANQFPQKGIWILSIPSKVSFFLWNACLDKILTINNLQRRCWNLANRCVICLHEESVNHIFVHYFMAHRIWGFFLSHLSISWSFPGQFQDRISGWGVKDLDGFPFII